MNPLTKEQLQIVSGIKAMIADYDYKTDQIRGLFDLVSIIDDLQSRAPKQYTEQELREAFEQSHIVPIIGLFDRFEENGGYKNPMIQAGFVGWKSCARFLGALKAKPRSGTTNTFRSP